MAARSVSFKSANTEEDGPENYETQKSIGTKVYVAKCKRGRLRGRTIALRKTANADMTAEFFQETSRIHQSLYHPSILSLFSYFTSSSLNFHVMDLCEGGSLQDRLGSRVSTEEEINDLSRHMLDALAYLKKEGIVHRNIQPSAIFFSKDGRIKLGDFRSSCRLPCKTFDVYRMVDHPHFVAPEIISGLPHDSRADLWSLGCTVIACISGSAPFTAGSIPGVITNILACKYRLPSDVSPSIRDFVTSLVQIEPERRMDLRNSLSCQRLLKASLNKPLNSDLFTDLPEKTLTELSSTILPRLHLNHINNQDMNLRKFIREDCNVDDLETTIYPRVVSDPLPRMSSNERKTTTFFGRLTHNRIDPPRIRSNDNKYDEDVSEDEEKILACEPPFPIGVTRPSPFSTRCLASRVYKTVYGSLTVLPSTALLVDFRAGDKRRGGQGDEVFVIEGKDDLVKVYYAPHLDVACSLDGTPSEYCLNDLPRRYWKQYNDAEHFVDRLKQRTPKLVLYDCALRSTLMANEPEGDIELLFFDPTLASNLPKSSMQRHQNDINARLRIRLSRRLLSLDIEECTTNLDGKEWIKKSLHVSANDFLISKFDYEGLDDGKKECIDQLAPFIRVCKTLERDRTTTLTPSSSSSRNTTLSVLPVHRVRPNYGQGLGHGRPTVPRPVSSTSRISTASSVTQTLSAADLLPRPRKFSSVPIIEQLKKTSPDLAYNTQDLASIEVCKTRSFDLASNMASSFKDSMLDKPLAVHTRFIESVGWCVRHGSLVSQGGRYKVMFLDGASLDVDADEEFIEYHDGRGSVTRCFASEIASKPKLVKRMRTFDLFINLFENAASLS